MCPRPAAFPRTITVKQRTFCTLADSAIFYGLLALLLFGPLAFGAVEPWAIFVFESGAGLLFVLWALRQLASPSVSPACTSPLFAPLLFFALLVVLQLLLSSTSYPQATFSEALLDACYALLCFLAVQTLQRTWQIRTLAITFSAYGSLIALFALLQSLTAPAKLYWLRTPHFGSWIYGPYPNHNHYAGLMEMLFPIPLVFSLTRHAVDKLKVLSVCSAAIMATSIFLSGSRGGMLAFAVQSGCFALLILKQKKTLGPILTMGAFSAVLLAMLLWLGGGELSHRIATLYNHPGSELPAEARFSINRDGLRMFLHKPLLGFGLGTFADVYPRFRSFYTSFIVNEAHNDYLQLLVETGVLGFSAVLWFIVVVFRRAFSKLQAWPEDTNGAVALAALLGIIGMLVHSFLDFNLHIPANAALFFVLCTVAAMEPRFGLHRHRSKAQLDSSRL